MKTRQRVIDHGEVFTPPGLVNDMLDLVKHECERIESRFLEPACGDGNFLAEVLRRKLTTVTKQHKSNPSRWVRDAILAVCSLYGIDLLSDNIEACRARLLEIVDTAHRELFGDETAADARRSLTFVLTRNIIQGDALTFRVADGSPIVFSEWSPINGALIKRRDYVYEHLIEDQRVASLPLFNELGEDVFLPTSVGERAPCHYLNLGEGETASERP